MTKRAAHSQRVPPAVREYLRYDVWTHETLRNLLCGFVPASPVSPFQPTAGTDAERQRAVEARDAHHREQVRREALRCKADRHIEDAILARHLPVILRADDRVLARVRPHVSSEEYEAIRAAVAHHAVCTRAARYSRDAAIQWADSRRGIFPKFPFRASEIPSPDAPSRFVREKRTVFGRNVARLRKNLGWSIEDLARKLGLDRSNVQRHESGKTSPHPTTQKKYADALEVKVEELFAE